MRSNGEDETSERRGRAGGKRSCTGRAILGGSTRSIASGTAAWLVISRGVGKVQSAVGHGRKERKRRCREGGRKRGTRGSWMTEGDGRRRGANRPRRTGDSPISRITYHAAPTCVRVYVRARMYTCRVICVCVTVHVHAHVHTHSLTIPLLIPPSPPFLSLSFFFPCSTFRLSFSLSRYHFSILPPPLSVSLALFSLSSCALSPPAAAAEGSLVFFLPGGARVSRAHTLKADRLQRVLKYRHARYTP